MNVSLTVTNCGQTFFSSPFNFSRDSLEITRECSKSGGRTGTPNSLLASKVSLPFRLSTFYPILTWYTHMTQHCRNICKIPLLTLFLTSKCRNSFHTWSTWVLHWGCTGLENRSSGGLSPLLKQPEWKLLYLEKFGNLSASGMRLLSKSMGRKCPGDKSALGLQCCRGYRRKWNEHWGAVKGSMRSWGSTKFRRSRTTFAAAQLPQKQAVSLLWAHSAAAVAGGQWQPTSVQCSVSSNLRNKSPVLRSVLQIPVCRSH